MRWSRQLETVLGAGVRSVTPIFLLLLNRLDFTNAGFCTQCENQAVDSIGCSDSIDYACICPEQNVYLNQIDQCISSLASAGGGCSLGAIVTESSFYDSA
jgi:hypothetical protein